VLSFYGSSVLAGKQSAARIGRREALRKLGLAATMAYVAPTILHLDRLGNAAVAPSCNGKKSKGNPWCGKKKGTKGM